MLLRWFFMPLWTFLYTTGIAPIKVEGGELVRRLGACIIVSNHVDGADGSVLEYAFPFPINFVVRKDYGKPALRLFLKLVTRIVWIDREEFALSQFREMEALLRSGRSMVIFAEGTRSTAMKRFHAGFVPLASRSRIPVVPVSISGTEDLLRGDLWKEIPRLIFRRRPPVRVIIHQPVKIQLAGRNKQEIADQIGLLVATGVGPMNRGFYAGRVATNKET